MPSEPAEPILFLSRPGPVRRWLRRHADAVAAVEHEQLEEPEVGRILVGALVQARAVRQARPGADRWQIAPGQGPDLAGALKVWRRCFDDPDFRRYWGISARAGHALAALADLPWEERAPQGGGQGDTAEAWQGAMDLGHGASDGAAAALTALAREIAACSRCPRLVAYRQKVAQERRRAYRDQTYWGRPVPGFGDPEARIALVGLAPAAHGANRTGRMFTGDRSGDFLIGALYRAGLASQGTSRHAGDGLFLRDAFLTATVRCAPPANVPLPEEVDACAPFLEAELRALPRLSVLVGLGAVGYRSACRVAARLWPDLSGRPPAFRHGVLWQPRGDRPPWIVASYHPSQQNTQTGRLTEAMMDRLLAEVTALSRR